MTDTPPVRRTLVRDLGATASGERVRVCGWVDRVGPNGFVLRDHTGTVPVWPSGDDALTPESAVEAWGVVADLGIVADCVSVAGPAQQPLPIDGASPPELRRGWRHLDLRRPRNRLVFEVQTTVERAMRDWWAAHGFLELHSPKLRATPNRSGRELFTVDYFDRPAYLVQSPQFYKQMAMAAGFDRVFEVGPVFRANPLVTARHDTEFVSVDVEVSWIDSHHDLMDLEEDLLRHVVAAVARDHGDDVERELGRTVALPDTAVPRITMAEAQRVLDAAGHVSTAEPGDIDAAGERLLAAHVAAAHGHELVFVTDYADAVRPFYHMRVEGRPDLTRSFDLLWNGLEITTGAQREHRHDRLIAQAGPDPEREEAIRGYLDFFRHGCPPHGGFGLGLTRLLMGLLGVADVRDVTFLHRDRDRLTP